MRGGSSACVLKTPTGRPYPSTAQKDRGDWGVTAAVWGRKFYVCPQTPTGRPYPSTGLGCNRRCVGESASCAPKPPRGAPLPPRPRQDRRDPGVTAVVWGGELFVCPQTPTGRPYPSTARKDRRDSGVTAAVWGRRVSCARINPWGFPSTPTGRPRPRASHAGPGGPGCHRPRRGSGGRGNYFFCT